MKPSLQSRRTVLRKIATALPTDPLLSKQYKACERVSVVFEEAPVPTELPQRYDASAYGHNRVVINVWPNSEIYSFVGYRVLNHETRGLPFWHGRQELAIDWLAELSLNGPEPLVSHLIQEEDGPVFFSHTLVFRAGRFDHRHEFDSQDMLDRFPRLVEPIHERILFLSAFLCTSDKFSEDK